MSLVRERSLSPRPSLFLGLFWESSFVPRAAATSGGYVNASFNDFTNGDPTSGNRLSNNGTYRASTTGEFAGYTTAIIANKSLEWLHSAPRGGSAPPFVMTVAPKAPHYPATPAPWYISGTYVDQEAAPRTPGFGVDPAVLRGHHAMIASQGPLLPNEERSVDTLIQSTNYVVHHLLTLRSSCASKLLATALNFSCV